MAGWLETVQRDPASMGAFRRRIEALLRDPAVARRVARQLNDALPLRPDVGRAPENPASTTRDTCEAPRRDCLKGSIFGRCDCDGACRLMPVDLQHLIGRKAPPVLVGATRH